MLCLNLDNIEEHRMSSYEQLQDLSEMAGGSLNRIQSDIFHLRRPPSLSDSFILTTHNIERASSFRYREMPRDPKESIDETPTIAIIEYDNVVTYILQFLFHICLISIFETLFFFHYVSALEDNGIVKTIDSFSNGIVESCSNMTTIEKDILNKYLSSYINASTIKRIGSTMYSTRYSKNYALMIHSWIYVLAISCIFIACYTFAYFKKRKINLNAVFLENIGFVTMLSLYELLFFSTIILPYTPISSQEILMNTVIQLEDQCQIL